MKNVYIYDTASANSYSYCTHGLVHTSDPAGFSKSPRNRDRRVRAQRGNSPGSWRWLGADRGTDLAFIMKWFPSNSEYNHIDF